MFSKEKSYSLPGFLFSNRRRSVGLSPYKSPLFEDPEKEGSGASEKSDLLCNAGGTHAFQSRVDQMMSTHDESRRSDQDIHIDDKTSD